MYTKKKKTAIQISYQHTSYTYLRRILIDLIKKYLNLIINNDNTKITDDRSQNKKKKKIIRLAHFLPNN